MNWSLFFATITWSLMIVSFAIGVWAACWVNDDTSERPLKYYLRILGVAYIVLMLCIATIAGMGWYLNI